MTDGLLDLVALGVALGVILVGAELFTNGIEWFGHKLDLAEGAVGSVLAAVGTALPETMIPTVAILFGGGAAAEAIGVGAVLGAPFMLATLAMFVTGVAVIVAGRSRPTGDRMIVARNVLGHDLRVFAVRYGIAIASALVPSELLAVRGQPAVPCRDAGLGSRVTAGALGVGGRDMAGILGASVPPVC